MASEGGPVLGVRQERGAPGDLDGGRGRRRSRGAAGHRLQDREAEALHPGGERQEGLGQAMRATRSWRGGRTRRRASPPATASATAGDRVAEEEDHLGALAQVRREARQAASTVRGFFSASARTKGG